MGSLTHLRYKGGDKIEQYLLMGPFGSTRSIHSVCGHKNPNSPTKYYFSPSSLAVTDSPISQTPDQAEQFLPKSTFFMEQKHSQPCLKSLPR